MSRLKEEMDLLFEKSFRKETNPEEEKTIEIYLSMSNLPHEHESYRRIIKKAQKQAEKRKFKIKKPANAFTKRCYALSLYLKFAILSIATLITILITLHIKKPKENFASIKGEQITNPEQIEVYAKEKILKIKSMLLGCLDPLEDIP